MSHVQQLVFDSNTKEGTAGSVITGYHIKLSEETAHPARSLSRKKKGDLRRSKSWDDNNEHTALNNP
jgi:hypothetical protein